VGSAAAYDPRVIERFAEQLLAKADSVRVGCAVGGGILGVLFGAVPLTGLKWVWTIPGSFGIATMLIGALVGVLVGWVIGEGRAFRYRVQAQMAYFQLEIERKVEASLEAALRPAPEQARVEAPAPAAVSAAPPVQALPDPEPSPVAVPPPPLPPLLRAPDEGSEPGLPPLSPPVAL
jgi:predicted lipid-binding transport protein (Tim44 family)